jgi:hypothetical protein
LHEDGQPELPCHVWRGTAEQFRRLWFITAGDSNFEGIKKMRWLCPGWLRGHLYREGIDSYRFVIESGYGLTRQMQKRILRQAAGDAGFQRFMARLRTPINTD